MTTGLTAAAVCEIHEVNPIGVDDGEGSSAGLGIRTCIFGVVTELEDKSNLPERIFLEIDSIPFLRSLTRQGCARSLIRYE